MRKKFKYFVIALALYLSISYIVYRFKHPDLTETQLILNIWKVITWEN